MNRHPISTAPLALRLPSAGRAGVAAPGAEGRSNATLQALLARHNDCITLIPERKHRPMAGVTAREKGGTDGPAH